MELSRIRLLLKTGDSLLCCFLFFPLMVCYWRGIWDLVGVYLNPDGKHENDWLIFGIGSCSVFGYFLLPLLNRYLDPEKRVVYVIVTRVYMYLQAALYMSYWRGVWVLGDYYIGAHWKHTLISLSVCLVFLSCVRGLRNTMWPPFFTSLDTRHSLLETNPRFGYQPDRPLLYICDSLFSHFAISTPAIIAWQSLWVVYYHLFFPDDALKTDVSALVIGFILCLTLLALQGPLGKVSVYLGEKRWIYKLIWEDVMYVVIFCSHVCLWRGLWNLNDMYWIQDDLVGGWVNHIIGTAGLMSLQLFSYVSFSGVVLDGGDTLGRAFFQTEYLQHYLLPRFEGRKVKTVVSSDNTNNNTGEDDSTDGRISLVDTVDA